MRGRRDETGRVDELIHAARDGRGGALVLLGEAGIGKSTLLGHARSAAAGFRVVEASGAEFEIELPYAGLHQLCVPLTRTFPVAPDLFQAGLKTLELLVYAARERPLLCLIDDAHWLDTASRRAMAFAARRIAAEPIVMIFAAREPGVLDELPGLRVSGLTDAEARAVLADGHRTLDEQVRERIVAEARGNPLALLELPSAGGFGPVADGPAGADSPAGGSGPAGDGFGPVADGPARVERSYRDRLAALPDGARLLLTVASADPTGDPGLLWPAVRGLEVDVPAATASGLVEFGTRVRFCHPLARSAVYRAAPAADRRTAHGVLAAVTDPAADPDRRAWHRAQAGTGPDDDIAAELERSAARARTRGGVVAAAAFLERAAALSLDPVARAERTLAAAQANLDAGHTEAAERLLTTVAVDRHTSRMDDPGGERQAARVDDPGGERHAARVDLLRGQIAFARRDDTDGPMLVLRAASRTAGTDPAWSRERVLDALEMALVAGRADGVLDLVLAAAPASRTPDVLSALKILTSDGHSAAVPLLRAALAEPLWTRHPGLAVMIASELWDPHTHAAIVEWLIKAGRESGSPQVLRLGLAQEASRAALAGDLDAATTAIAEEEAIADATGLPRVYYHRLQVAAMRGRPDEALFAAALAAPGSLVANVHWAEAVLRNGIGDYPAALAAAQRAVSCGDLFLAGAALPELVEAAVRCGAPATEALRSLTERTDASGTATGLGVAAYAKGLVLGVEDHYREAVERLAESPLLPYRGRAHLLYGEWLRRQGRRRDSRQHLRTAHETLSAAGIEAFARRAADELRATGERRASPDSAQLTDQEQAIAREVAAGATSGEVAARLFISPRTVDAHLRNIFRKLGVTSRRQLRDHPALSAPR
ncbi:LuxR family transcriptional regulator [Actinoplanes sp. NBRC 103695]|uniref:LuxR family transcriptional regulator n=1 Tax=Actinoplanes sp. NBRC 103695 TaxID=3032202 RepID=UPI0024A0A75A|nr:LuxR family transcriptional regulator [Actinoplanes sp. NBRC 103695]GLZ01965.1 LuxR family transcriptional regulator [Actinoplanes sp. NBRC 103695]